MNEDSIREFVKNLDYEDTQVLHKFLDEKWKRKERYNVSFDIFLSENHNYDIRKIVEDMVETEFSKPKYEVGEGLWRRSISIGDSEWADN